MRPSAAIIVFLSLSAPAAFGSSSASYARLSPRLAALVARHAQRSIQISPNQVKKNTRITRIDNNGRVQIDVFFNCETPPAVRDVEFSTLMNSQSVRMGNRCVIEGWAGFDAIPALAELQDVSRVDLPVYSSVVRPQASSPQTANPAFLSAIDANGITVMHTDKYVQSTGKDGSGITVGVLSDDVTSLPYIQSAGILPDNILLIPMSTNPTPTDEGIMMLEEVHAVAPGANLAFCGPQTEVEYISCLQAFASNGVALVADDLGFLDDDEMSSQDSFSKAVATVLQQNPDMTLFSAAGNDNGEYWQGDYQPTPILFNGNATLTCAKNGQVDQYAETFDGGMYDTLTLKNALPGPLHLAWADTYGANASNFDLYLLDSSFKVELCVPGVGNTETYDELDYLPAGTYNLVIATPDTSESGKMLKLVAFGDGSAQLSVTTPGSLLTPQDFAPGVITVGAVNAADGIGGQLEPYSSIGPVQLALPAPQTIQAPVLVAPDNVVVVTGGTYFSSSPFQGTSAAAPNAAAVAALLESTFPDSATLAIQALEKGADPLGQSTPSPRFGDGRVDAMSALATIPSPTVSSIGTQSISANQVDISLPFSVGGTGPLSVTASSDNPLVIKKVAINPATCGLTTDQCQVVVTKGADAGYTAMVTIQATDNANRAAMSTFSVSVLAPVTKSTSSSSSGSGGGGGAAGWVSILFLAALSLKGRRLDPRGKRGAEYE